MHRQRHYIPSRPITDRSWSATPSYLVVTCQQHFRPFDKKTNFTDTPYIPPSLGHYCKPPPRVCATRTETFGYAHPQPHAHRQQCQHALGFIYLSVGYIRTTVLGIFPTKSKTCDKPQERQVGPKYNISILLHHSVSPRSP